MLSRSGIAFCCSLYVSQIRVFRTICRTKKARQSITGDELFLGALRAPQGVNVSMGATRPINCFTSKKSSSSSSTVHSFIAVHPVLSNTQFRADILYLH